MFFLFQWFNGSIQKSPKNDKNRVKNIVQEGLFAPLVSATTWIDRKHLAFEKIMEKNNKTGDCLL